MVGVAALVDTVRALFSDVAVTGYPSERAGDTLDVFVTVYPGGENEGGVRCPVNREPIANRTGYPLTLRGDLQAIEEGTLRFTDCEIQPGDGGEPVGAYVGRVREWAGGRDVTLRGELRGAFEVTGQGWPTQVDVGQGDALVRCYGPHPAADYLPEGVGPRDLALMSERPTVTLRARVDPRAGGLGGVKTGALKAVDCELAV
ncbi:hypothetical protein BSZ37_12795 [Rubrivirga marina]|uniref:Uncharacterized protein n=1 Tax=Rubrivirga marina TaxID=1196024 RepID=A0A271J1W4_9BACT|nr:hypothetical protein BSZ37_12795 [Rubrivirga marina]